MERSRRTRPVEILARRRTYVPSPHLLTRRGSGTIRAMTRHGKGPPPHCTGHLLAVKKAWAGARGRTGVRNDTTNAAARRPNNRLTGQEQDRKPPAAETPCRPELPVQCPIEADVRGTRHGTVDGARST
jgi:hypothetical protein